MFSHSRTVVNSDNAGTLKPRTDIFGTRTNHFLCVNDEAGYPSWKKRSTVLFAYVKRWKTFYLEILRISRFGNSIKVMYIA